MFCASLRSAKHVKMQQEVSDLNGDYVTICLRQNNCGWSNHHQSISKFFSITQFTQNRGIHIKLSTTVIYYIPIRYIRHAGIVIKDHLNWISHYIYLSNDLNKSKYMHHFSARSISGWISGDKPKSYIFLQYQSSPNHIRIQFHC